jgi:hypothetical protein
VTSRSIWAALEKTPRDPRPPSAEIDESVESLCGIYHEGHGEHEVYILKFVNDEKGFCVASASCVPCPSWLS